MQFPVRHIKSITIVAVMVFFGLIPVRSGPPASVPRLRSTLERRATHQALAPCESTGFESSEGACGWELGWICGSTFANCSGPPIPESCTGDPTADVDCCAENPNPLNGWYVSSGNQHCMQPHISTANPSTGSQHLRFSRDATGGNPVGCGGFSPGCQISALTPGVGPDIPIAPVTISMDVAAEADSASFSSGVLRYLAFDDTPGEGPALHLYFYPLYGYVYAFDYGLSQFLQIGAMTGLSTYDTVRVEFNPCAGVVEYYFNDALAYTTSSDGGGQRISRGMFLWHNNGQLHDVDNYSVVRGAECFHLCGNDITEPHEECDQTDDAACPGFCRPPGDPAGECTCVQICGDGLVEGSETCDDGDSSSGDGCSSVCAVEIGYTCDGSQPSVCADINECVLGTDDCDVNATCTNVPGGYFCTCNCRHDLFVTAQKVTAPDGEVGDRFGVSVSVDGDSAIVGADQWNAMNGNEPGAAYVYRRIAGSWALERKLVALDGAANDRFGFSVSISGDVAIVGAFWDDDACPSVSTCNSGSAYVFHRNAGGTNNWGQVAKLIGAGVEAADTFGFSVSVSGDTAIVGAAGDDDRGNLAGAAYLFRRDAGGADNWGQVAKISASDGTGNDHFGAAVSISGNAAVVGAWGDWTGLTEWTGSAYVFRHDIATEVWAEEQKLVLPEVYPYQFFGGAVAVYGDRAVIGNRNSFGGRGAAYVFGFQLGTWTLYEKVAAFDGAEGDRLGDFVAIYGDVVLIGAWEDDDLGSGCGSAYLFRGNGSACERQTKLLAFDGSAGDGFGSVSVSGGAVLVGASADSDNSGSVYFFDAPPISPAGCTEANDVDECSLGAHDCSLYATCTNFPGGYVCACNPGYVGDGIDRILVDSGQALGDDETRAVLTGDIDGDGDQDVLSLDGAPVFFDGIVRIYRNDGTGIFTASGGDAFAVTMMDPHVGQLRDMNEDGHLDLVIGGNDGSFQSPSAGLRLYSGDGTGSFSEAWSHSFGKGGIVESIALGDVDGNGPVDIVAAGYLLNGESVHVCVNSAPSTYQCAPLSTDALYVWDALLADLDNDQDVDLALALQEPYVGIKVFLNAEGILADTGQSLAAGHLASVAAADLNANGALDLVIADADSVHILLNDGAGAFTNTMQALGTGSYTSVLGDIDEDGDADIVALQGSYTVFENNGFASFTEREDGSPGGHGGVLVDVNADGALDMITRSDFTEPKLVFINHRGGCVLTCPPIFVDASAAGAKDGSSWSNAFTSLQDGLAATPTCTPSVWVAAGTYKPDQGASQTPGDRLATFQLINGQAVYGGFPPGGGNGTFAARNVAAYPTTLSGDLASDDAPVACVSDSPDCDALGRRCLNGFCIIASNNSENSHHVVTGGGTNATARIDGVTITAGNSNGEGGGLYNVGGSPTVVNCTFSGNRAGGAGGGMFNWSNSSPRVSDCTFRGNFALAGGGISNDSSSPTVTNCTFNGNSALLAGGGMENFTGSSPIVTNCTFVGNSAILDLGGGGIFNWAATSPVVANCLFSGNRAPAGGAMYNENNSIPSVKNCAFSANVANAEGGAIYTFGSGLSVANSIFWGNIDDADGNAGGPFLDESAQIHVANGAPEVNYSIVQGGWSGAGGTGILTVDPLFDDSDGPDNIPGTMDDDLRLLPSSPAIDAGDNAAVATSHDLVGNGRILDGDDDGSAVVDMGAYEAAVAVTVNAGQTVEISPGAAAGSLTQDASVSITNESGQTATVSVAQTTVPQLMDAGGFEALGTFVVIDVALADGSFTLTVVAPFNNANIPRGTSPIFDVNLGYHDPLLQTWVYATCGNVLPGTGCDGNGSPLGSRHVEGPGPPPALSEMHGRPIGDYGVYWDGSAGFAWANVDHASIFAPVSESDPSPLLPDAAAIAMGRFVSFGVPASAAGTDTALRAELTSLHHPPSPPPGTPNFAAFEGQFRYVNSFGGLTLCVDSATFGTNYRCGQLGCQPEYRDWATELSAATNPASPAGLVHVTGDTVLPSSTLSVSHIAASCGAAPSADTCASASASLAASTSRWGDVGSGGAGAPDGATNVIDIGLVVDNVKGLVTSIPERRAWMKNPTNPFTNPVNVIDIGLTVDAVKGLPYPYNIATCP